jgi:hypothetical protein
MILNNAPVNEAVLSNVGEIGEFRIRNSAKAFNILSSGLYANKVRAIVRELSCNAVDSHILPLARQILLLMSISQIRWNHGLLFATTVLDLVT